MKVIQQDEKSPVNVSPGERIVSTLAGAWMVYCGLRKKVNIPEVLTGSYLIFRGYSGFCYMYDYFGKKRLPNPNTNINLRVSTIVPRSPMEVYNHWKDFSLLPAFFKHIRSVKRIDEVTTEWTAEIFHNVKVMTWKAEVVKDEPGKLIAWKSLEGSFVRNAGKVEFHALDPFNTRVEVVITYASEGGIGPDLVLRAFNPVFQKMIEADMASFRERIDTLFPVQHIPAK